MVRVVPYPDTLWFSRLSACHLGLHHATTLKTSLLNPTSPFTMVISWALCWRLCQSRTLGDNSHHEPSLTPDMCVTWRDCINFHPNPTGVPRPLTCTTLRVSSHLERSVSSKTEVKHTLNHNYVYLIVASDMFTNYLKRCGCFISGTQYLQNTLPCYRLLSEILPALLCTVFQIYTWCNSLNILHSLLHAISHKLYTYTEYQHRFGCIIIWYYYINIWYYSTIVTVLLILYYCSKNKKVIMSNLHVIPNLFK